MVWLIAHALAAPPEVEAVDAFFTAEHEAGRFVGLVHIRDGDEVLLDRAYGVPADSLCRIGSLSKSFTAATVYALQDEGAWSVDDPVGQYLPSVAAAVGDGPTLRQLMTHHGGLSEPAYNPWMQPGEWSDFAAVMVPDLEQEAPPGTRERYSNFGYVLLAGAIEAVSGQRFEDAVRQRVMEPAGLVETGIVDVDHSRTLEGRLVTPLGLVRAQRALPRLMPFTSQDPVGGAGAFTSSARDLARWAQALHEGRVLSEASHRALVTPAEGSDTAAGWVRDGDVVWHNGALVPLGIYGWTHWSVDNDRVVALCGAPTVFDSTPEWGAPLRQALDGHTPESPTQTSGWLGALAAASTLRLHWLLAVLSAAVLLLGRTSVGRIGATLVATSGVLIGVGFTSIPIAVVAAAVTVVGAVVAYRRWPAQQRGGTVGILAVLLGAACVVLALAVLTVLGGMTFLTHNFWTIAGAR